MRATRRTAFRLRSCRYIGRAHVGLTKEGGSNRRINWDSKFRKRGVWSYYAVDGRRRRLCNGRSFCFCSSWILWGASNEGTHAEADVISPAILLGRYGVDLGLGQIAA